MKKQMITKLALFVVVLSILVSACGGQTTAAPTTSAATAAPTKVPPTTVPPTPEPPVDLEIWTEAAVSEAGPPPEDWVGYEIIREKLNINLTVIITPRDADGIAKLNAAAAANALPDLLRIADRNQLYQFSQLGLLAPVDQLLPLIPASVAQRHGDPELNKLATWDGVMYALVEPPAIPMREGLVIRQDWLDKLGLKMPTTLDETFEVAKAFTEQDPDGNGENDTYGVGGFLNGNGLGTRFDWIMGAYGVTGMWNLESASSFGLNVRDPNYIEAVAYVNKLVAAKVIDPDWPTLKRDDFRARWKQGKFGIMWEDYCALMCKANYAAFDTNFPDAEWAVMPAPKGPEGKSAYGPVIRGSTYIVIPQTTVDTGKLPAIAKLLEWMTTDEGYYLLGFGQEGVNYKLDQDGNVTIEGIDPALAWTSAEQQPLTQLRGWAYYNAPVELKVRYPTFTSVNGRTIDPLAYLAQYQEQPWIEATGVGIINPPSNAADFNRFYSEYLIKAAMGQEPLDETAWAEYLKGLDGLGAGGWELQALKTLMASGFIK